MIIIGLQKQVHIYSIDTSDLYNEYERQIHLKMNKYYLFKHKLEGLLQSKKHKSDRHQAKINHYISVTTKKIKALKNQLLELLELNKDVRVIREESFNKKNVISLFESSLTRTMGLKTNELTRDIIVIRVFYFKVLKDIINNGFIDENGEKYVCFTASAGQIRTKKVVFVKESRLKQHYLSLTCGLTTDHINANGGININKFLAYLALSNSATDPWSEFNIDKAIVVDDFETEIECEVDFIDHHTFTIERKVMKIPINHTDGCGMILPSLSSKAMMVRLPWIKGLLVPFAFDSFIRQYCNGIAIVKDIYGQEHDIISDGIQVIFTKSQFKMHQFYKDWNEYKHNFKKYNCESAKCNEEPGRIGCAKINYQMLQTLTDMSQEEVKLITNKTRQNIDNISKDKNTMLKALGVTVENENKNYFQQAIEIYPELLRDTYSLNVLKQIKQSMVKEAKSGKLDINGKYTFIIPDLYAFSQHLFLGDTDPPGLLANGEVSCKLYPNGRKLDCLRSPHLYIEHAVRTNKVNKLTSEWFITKGIHTSCHDPISKILMFDVDGDQSLVVADKTLVEIAERNTQNIVPLYYEMKKAQPCIISPSAIYNGLTTAYTGGNIGIFSNNISKVFNSENIDLDIIKILTAQNNYVIDYAKTLYKPNIPKEVKEKILSFTKNKLPYFFKYAKDKTDKQVEKPNGSTMNRITKSITNKRMMFKPPDFENEFDYTNLLYNKNYRPNINSVDAKKIITLYSRLDINKKFIYTIETAEEKLNGRSEPYAYWDIRQQLLTLNPNIWYVVDVLVEYLYNFKMSNFKTTLWSSFGDVLIENLRRNIDVKYTYCEQCGCHIKKTSNRLKYCEQCKENRQREWWKKSKKKNRAR